MRCLLIYDIQNDRIRNKVADLCQDYGLDRIQYSSFWGKLSRNHQEELLLKISKKVGKHPCKVLLLPVCVSDWEQRLELVIEEKEG
ncbi:MAG: CRISPR-associated endonuclease Cas2 [Caldilineae bacterium]|nr:MAG: CRISPR-associated endonuclease Cas2 [Caldilineae bacterium]